MSEYHPPLTISVHGIRDHGHWQKQLGEIIQDIGPYHAYDYGRLSFLRFILERERQRITDRFADWLGALQNDSRYRIDFRDPNRRPSVIAHSFGTYVVTKALEQNESLRLDKLITCGCILDRDYDWTLLLGRDQLGQIYHEIGPLDWATRMVRFAVPNTGDSGGKGFVCDDVRLRQHAYVSYDHHRFLRVNHMRSAWRDALTEPPSAYSALGSESLHDAASYAHMARQSRELDRVVYAPLQDPMPFAPPQGRSNLWWAQNAAIYTYLLLRGNRDQVVGYINAMPLTEDAYARIQAGQLADGDVLPTDIESYSPGARIRLYLMSIVIHPDHRASRGGLGSPALHALLNSAVGKLRQLYLSHNVVIESMCGIAWTKEGQHLCRMLGMDALGRDAGSHTVFACSPIELARDRLLRQRVRFHGFRKLLEAYAHGR